VEIHDLPPIFLFPSKMIPTVYQTDDLTLIQIEESNTPTSYEAFGYYITLPNGVKVSLG